MEFFRIDKNYMKNNVDTFISILEKVPNEYWSDAHFLQDYNGKWEYSVGIELEGILIAFIIASVKEENIHIHKFMVSENYRSHGVGKILLNYFIELVSYNFTSITLKVYCDNIRAIDFYLSNGFIKINLKNNLIEMRKDII